ncbi:uncharacterized [Tachysurus ichikawai]
MVTTFLDLNEANLISVSVQIVWLMKLGVADSVRSGDELKCTDDGQSPRLFGHSVRRRDERRAQLIKRSSFAAFGRGLKQSEPVSVDLVVSFICAFK